MNTIEKQIFDTLAAGGGINLPGLGSLHVERRATRFISGKTLRPPHNQVVFLPTQNPAYPSADTTGNYAEWLRHTAQGTEVREFNGVGVLRGTAFYPSVELHELLNPQGTEPVAVKSRYGAGRKLLVGLGVVAAAALVLLLVVRIGDFAGRQADIRQPRTNLRTAQTEAAGAEARGESTITPTVAEEVREEALSAGNTGSTFETVAADATSAATENLPTDNAPATADNGSEEAIDNIQHSLEAYAATTPRYHLVAGVFSDPANADKLIAKDPLGIGSANYRKVAFGNGKTLVSAFSSADRAAAEKRKRQLAAVNNELWIYEKP